MELIKVEDAIGQVLCHDVTQIVKGVTKDALFRKGHVISEGDILPLKHLGKDHVFIWRANEDILHENDGADILRALCQGPHMHATLPKEGKIELIADMDGLLIVDVERLRAVNSLGEMMIATRPSGFPVKRGDKLCGTRIIPLVIQKEKMERARQIVGSAPLLKLIPFRKKRYGLITTGNEVFSGRIEDTFSPIIRDKLEEYDCEPTFHQILNDDPQKIAAAIGQMFESGAEMVFCTGGMSVDPDDKTPLAIKSSAAVVAYGAPVLPGAMFMVAYTAKGLPICGLPGCVMYAKRTIFDLALPLLLADVPITSEWLAGLGHGGLCLSCQECRFPNCAFGKGV